MPDQRPQKATSPIRDTDAQAIALAHKLIDNATFAALGYCEPDTAIPLVTRIGIARSHNGAPIMLISDLANHTKALRAAPDCSLLLGEPGKGDPLAHPRITLIGQAQMLPRNHPDHPQNRDTYLASHPKAALYLDFTDFNFWQFNAARAHLNGGFGKAYILDANDLKNR